MAAVFLAGAFATQVAEGEVAVTIGVDTGPVAPLAATVTASASSDEPIIAYDWGLLPSATRCRQRTCELEIPIASCRNVHVEATTTLGERGVAEEQVCAGDDEGQPPRVRIAVRDGAQLEVEPVAMFGSDRVALVRLWVDDREPVDDGKGMIVPVDALVVDTVGRVGFDSRTLCTGKDAPIAWFGYDAICPTLGATQTICNEVTSEVSARVSTSSISDFDVNTCVTKPAPTELVRELLVSEDHAGRRTYAGAFRCGAPADGPLRLLFAALPDGESGVSGASLTVRLLLYGGRPPFDITASMDGAFVRVEDESTAQPRLRISSLPLVPADETHEYELRMSIADANGLTASAVTTVTVRGQLVVGPGPVAESGAACTTASPAAMSPWLCVIALGVFARRRRR
jgi:hypothetical protein